MINRVVDRDTGLKQRSRLFIVPGISEQTHFATQTRKEISKIAWHPIGGLVKEEGKKYFFVKPFVQPLLKWIKTRKRVAGKGVGRRGWHQPGASERPAGITQRGRFSGGAHLPLRAGGGGNGERFPTFCGFRLRSETHRGRHGCRVRGGPGRIGGSRRLVRGVRPPCIGTFYSRSTIFAIERVVSTICRHRSRERPGKWARTSPSALERSSRGPESIRGVSRRIAERSNVGCTFLSSEFHFRRTVCLCGHIYGVFSGL